MILLKDVPYVVCESNKFALNSEFLDPLNYSWSNDIDLIEHEGLRGHTRPGPNAII